MQEEPRIRIGVLTRAYGLAGGVRCALTSEAEPRIAVPCDVWLGYSEAFVQQYRLERYESRGHELICYFAGFTSPERAETLVDQALFLPSSALTYSDPLSDPRMIGLEVRSEEGAMLGTVTGIFKTPAHFVWSIEQEGREWMLPALGEFIIEIRPEERHAIVRLIPGLFEEEQENEPDRE